MAGYKRGKKQAEEIQEKERSRTGIKQEVILDLVSTGCTLLDLALGGGLPWGKNINIVGERSAGKTILTCEIIAQADKIYNDILQHKYNDAENGFSIPTIPMYGLDICNQDDYKSNTIEELKDDIANETEVLNDDEKLIYVTDTVEGLQSEEELLLEEENKKLREKGEKSKGSYGGQKAAHMNQLLKSKPLQKLNVMPIFVSQVRDKIGVTFGSVKTRHCERALEFYCSIILYLRVAKELTKTIDKKTYTIGSITEIAIKKNKVIGSKFKPLIIFRDGLGIDNVDTNVCFYWDLIDGKFAIKEQINVEFYGKEFKKRSKLIEYIEENDLESEIEKLVTEKWKGIVEKLAPSNRKKRFI